MHLVDGADAHGIIQNGNTLLHILVEVKDHPIVPLLHRLIAKGADIDARSRWGNTPLHIAAKDAPVVACALINLGASLTIRDGLGRTPLHLAAEHGNLEVLHLILARKGADVHVIDNYKRTLLHLLCGCLSTSRKDGNYAMELLLENGVDVDARDLNGETCLHYAAKSAAITLIFQLLRLGANANVVDKEGRNPMHALAESCRPDPWENLRICAESLVAHGAVIEGRDNQLRTPLHYATCRDISVARYLIEQGADVFARDSSGGMALDNVAGCGWPDVQPLIDEAAARDPQFLARALLYTARGGSVEIARYLIGRGADARGDRELSWAPICLASFHGHLDMVRLLI
ncbi:ankyrin repeat-containing domain protein, partial [Schizophyllum commune]